MVDQEGLKLETELEIKNVEVEIKELEIEIYRNNLDSIHLKEDIEEKVPKEDIEVFLSGNNPNNPILSNNIKRMGKLTYINYGLEDEKFSLISYKEDLVKQLENMEKGIEYKG